MGNSDLRPANEIARLWGPERQKKIVRSRIDALPSCFEARSLHSSWPTYQLINLFCQRRVLRQQSMHIVAKL